MASKSRTAQGKLAELEKNSTPFEGQLLEAARFVGVKLNDVGRSSTEKLELVEGYGTPVYHGREEWLLRWLLKRLQDQKDDAPRKNPNSWILLCHLVRVIPLPMVARMLNERNFMTILRQTLEEAQKQEAVSNERVATETPRVGAGSEDRSLKVSKKRKRSGELISASNGSRNHVQKLPAAIFSAIHHMLRLTKVTSKISDGRTTAFSTEYLKSVIRTPAEDAAKILGAWLSLCCISLRERQILDPDSILIWLSPFIEIWDSRAAGSEDFVQFSLYCSQPLLSLYKVMKGGETTSNWMDEMEQLAARNIIIPAKVTKLDNADSDLLNTLTRISVIQESANAPILFEVAIRSIQAQGSRLRRPNDESWLRTVFTALKDAMPSQRAEENANAIQEMLQISIKYKVVLELSKLRLLASEYCLLQGSTNWELLATIIKLDANVLLIPDDHKDLVQLVMTRITAACLRPTWSELSVYVISEVVVPLMNGFAKARDLSAFIRHWHGELAEFEKLRKERPSVSTALFSAWEDELLQAEFSKTMEASLTVPQISQLLDWLSSQVAENLDATCLILEAMAGSISKEEVVDAVGLRPFQIMFGKGTSGKLDERYKWRSWRVISRSLKWITQSGLEELSVVWEEGGVPFSYLLDKLGNGSLLNVGNTMELETLEILRCACAAFNASKAGTTLYRLAKKPVLDAIHSLSQDFKLLPQALTGDIDLDKEGYGSPLHKSIRGLSSMLWSSICCVLVEYPKFLVLGTEMKGNTFRDLLQTIFWIASVPKDNALATSNSWLRNNPDIFSSTWTSLLHKDEVLSNLALISLIIDIMLCNAANDANPLIRSPAANSFAVQCLLELPLESFSRKDRERVMTTWLPKTDSASDEPTTQCAALGGAVLSLKVKIMQRPTTYEGAKYQDLVILADALASAKVESMDVSLQIFKELVRRTMSHITVNLDQTRNREYVLDSLSHLRRNLKASNKQPHKFNFALVALLEVLFGIFASREMQLSELDIIPRHEFLTLKEAFQSDLLSQLESLLTKIDKSSKSSKSSKQAERSLILRSIMDALAKLGADSGKIASTVAKARSLAASLKDYDTDLVRRLETLIAISHLSPDVPAVESQLEGDISTAYGRQALAERTCEFINLKDQRQKLALLQSSLEHKWSWTQLDKLWAVRHIIISCEDSRQGLNENDEIAIDVSGIYSLLCSHLWQTNSIRQFSLISETMVMMLRSKSRTMNQWNIDSTLGDITIFCSRNAPALRPTRAGSIYTHLCQILQTLLISHRLKLEGHFHLVVQAMQSLLRCLFTPLPHSTSKSSKIFAPPPWLSSPTHQLSAKHAAAFTRLVTLICDPSVSFVTRSKHNNLTSSTDKAKRMAGQHMHFVLTLYVQLQLEMRMLPKVREKMVPGLYAIFDTTTPETRRMISDGLDSSGRAVFGILFKDYQKFGKWKGL